MRCTHCRHTYDESGRKRLLAKGVYWCPGCVAIFKRFNPFPPAWFAPELAAEHVLTCQKAYYDSGMRANWFRK